MVIKRTDRIPVPSPVRVVRRGCALALLAFCRGALLDHDEALLALALVPLERARDGVEPVGAPLVCTHGRKRVLGRSDLDAVALLDFDAPAPSNEAHGVKLELNGTQIRNSIVSSSSIGRHDSVCGQIGEMRIVGISGCTSPLLRRASRLLNLSVLRSPDHRLGLSSCCAYIASVSTMVYGTIGGMQLPNNEIHNEIIKDFKCLHWLRRKTPDFFIFPAMSRGGLEVATLECPHPPRSRSFMRISPIVPFLTALPFLVSFSAMSR